MTNKESSKIIQDFRSQLNKKQNAAIDLRANATDKDGNRLYSQEELDNSPDEYLAFFSDAIAKNEIKFDEGLGTMLMDFITPILRKVGFAKIKFNTGKDVYNFMREYDKSIKSGKLSKSIQEDLVPGVTTVDSGDAKLSRSEDASNKLSKITIGEQLEAVLPEGMTNEEYKENGWKSVLAEVMTTDVLDGVIRNELKRRDIDTSGLDANVFGQPIEDFVEDVKGSAELQNTIKRWDGRGTIGGFIVTELQKFRIGDVSNKLKNKPQTQSIEGNIKAQNVIVEEDSSGGIVDDKLPKMPSETTKYQNALVDNLGIKESEINAALDKVIKEAYTDKKIVTFGDTRVLPKSVADFYGKMFGINPQTLTDKTRNFQKYDAEGLTRAKQYLIANAPGDYSRLPKTKTDSNKGTFIPRKVTESLYTDGKLTGSLKDYMNLIKERPVKPIYRDKVSQTIRGLLGVNIRNRVFETVVPSQGQRLIGGAKFSLSTKQDLDWSIDEAENRNTSFTIGDKTYNVQLNARDLGADQDADPTNYSLEFDQDGSQELTGKGDQFKAVSIIYNGLIDEIKSNPNIATVSFNALASETSRVKLYDVLLDKLSEELGWTAEKFDYESDGVVDEIGFEMYKPEETAKEKFSKTSIFQAETNLEKILSEGFNDYATETNKKWPSLFKSLGIVNLNLNDKAQREKFLEDLISTEVDENGKPIPGLASKFPKSFWRNFQGTSTSVSEIDNGDFK